MNISSISFSRSDGVSIREIPAVRNIGADLRKTNSGELPASIQKKENVPEIKSEKKDQEVSRGIDPLRSEKKNREIGRSIDPLRSQENERKPILSPLSSSSNEDLPTEADVFTFRDASVLGIGVANLPKPDLREEEDVILPEQEEQKEKPKAKSEEEKIEERRELQRKTEEQKELQKKEEQEKLKKEEAQKEAEKLDKRKEQIQKTFEEIQQKLANLFYAQQEIQVIGKRASVRA